MISFRSPYILFVVEIIGHPDIFGCSSNRISYRGPSHKGIWTK